MVSDLDCAGTRLRQEGAPTGWKEDSGAADIEQVLLSGRTDRTGTTHPGAVQLSRVV